MNARRGRPLRAAAAVAAGLLVAGLLSACDDGAAAQGPSTTARPAGSVLPGPGVPAAGDPYARAVDAVAASGAQVWLETDLLRRWLQGRGPFDRAVQQVAALARRPGVQGIKIADELGYEDDTSGPQQVQAFLHDAARALRAAAPGRRLLVDVLVPELGCLPWRGQALPAAAACAHEQAQRYPAAAEAAVDGYLRSGDVDVVDLSIGLRSDATYETWGVPRDVAVQEAWGRVRQRGWDHLVQMQARKALAHPGTYGAGPSAAERDLTTFVDTPLAAGAAAVDVWTWRQQYQGSVVRLLDPGLQDNDLWRALLARSRRGDVLWTHLSPSSLEVDLPHDLAALRTVFGGVFVAAGTG